jgi:hypothetical protein
VFLVEYDGNYRRLFTWLWQYGLSRDSFNTFKIEIEVTEPGRSGSSVWMTGGRKAIKIHETVLERNWPGRLYLQEHRKRRLALLWYLLHDIKMGFVSLFSQGCSDV